MLSKIKNGLKYDRKIVTVGYDFYALYVWPETNRKQNIVDGNIKYFRIRLNYKNLDVVYKYLLTYYEKDDIVNYIKILCNKFYVPTYNNVTIEDVNEENINYKNESKKIEINIISKIFILPKYIIENNNYLYKYTPKKLDVIKN